MGFPAHHPAFCKSCAKAAFYRSVKTHSLMQKYACSCRERCPQRSATHRFVNLYTERRGRRFLRWKQFAFIVWPNIPQILRRSCLLSECKNTLAFARNVGDDVPYEENDLLPSYDQTFRKSCAEAAFYRNVKIHSLLHGTSGTTFPTKKMICFHHMTKHFANPAPKLPFIGM